MKMCVRICFAVIGIPLLLFLSGLVYIYYAADSPAALPARPEDYKTPVFSEIDYFNEYQAGISISDQFEGPIDLTVNGLTNPVGINTDPLRFSWNIYSMKYNISQTSYEITVFDTQSDVVWNSGVIKADDTSYIQYAGKTLAPNTSYSWLVKVTLNDGSRYSSKIGTFTTGFAPAANAFTGRWITNSETANTSLFIKDFTIESQAESGIIYYSARGVCEFFINGQKVDRSKLAPGYTDYNNQIQYVGADVLHLLKPGKNRISAILAKGWYSGSVGMEAFTNVYGDTNALWAELHISATGGAKIISSDESWQVSRKSPIIRSDLMLGEVYDARISGELGNWQLAEQESGSWLPANFSENQQANLVSCISNLPAEHETFKPRILTSPDGNWVLDFGQNMAGYVAFRITGPIGYTVELQHGEALDKDGNFSVSNLLNSKVGFTEDNFQKVSYTIGSNKQEYYKPRFSIFGFRYVLLKNWPGDPKPEDFTAIAVYSDLEETAEFTSSNPWLNRLARNTLWSQKSNFVDIPTDCPQRERAGWTGDAQVYLPTASLFMNTDTFYRKWLADMRTAQSDEGKIPNIIPAREEHTDYQDISSGWGDAAIYVPWEHYRIYRDSAILEENYDMMKAWLEFEIAEAAKSHILNQPIELFGNPDMAYVWDTGFHWGEWLEPGRPFIPSIIKRKFFGEPETATAYLAYSAQILSRIADILGKAEDRDFYAGYAEKAKAAYLKHCAKPLDSIVWQAELVRPLMLDLVPEDRKQAYADKLAKLVKNHNYKLNTGFLSTAGILDVLSQNGHSETAWEMLNQKDMPGWLYPLTKGATTIWEKWDAVSYDGTLKESSLNHYAYGAVSRWLFTTLCGIQSGDSPGYKQFTIAPWIPEDLEYASAKYKSPEGLIESGWRKTEAGLEYAITIPANTTARLTLPAPGRDIEILDNAGNRLSIEVERSADAYSFMLGSGEYRIRSYK